MHTGIFVMRCLLINRPIFCGIYRKSALFSNSENLSRIYLDTVHLQYVIVQPSDDSRVTT